ncbi:MAG: cysteine methyltransferase [Candidatus Aegiribacteria sp.]|nr:cysteine methyltransferase [Candidatus Aegiribacteria sp.]MBD3294117.1 cysteine methyltransferase [Candidatus Fermentibacteria bacterium]
MGSYDTSSTGKKRSLYERIYSVVKQIPSGKVATYGQIARIAGHCSARNVGYAMSGVKDTIVPWHRVINSRGRISVRSHGEPSEIQRQMLLSEGIVFESTGSVDLSVYGWPGPEDRGNDDNEKE